MWPRLEVCTVIQRGWFAPDTLPFYRREREKNEETASYVETTSTQDSRPKKRVSGLSAAIGRVYRGFFLASSDPVRQILSPPRRRRRVRTRRGIQPPRGVWQDVDPALDPIAGDPFIREINYCRCLVFFYSSATAFASSRSLADLQRDRPAPPPALRTSSAAARTNARRVRRGRLAPACLARVPTSCRLPRVHVLPRRKTTHARRREGMRDPAATSWWWRRRAQRPRRPKEGSAREAAVVRPREAPKTSRTATASSSSASSPARRPSNTTPRLRVGDLDLLA
jgi:hypothetical protein